MSPARSSMPRDNCGVNPCSVRTTSAASATAAACNRHGEAARSDGGSWRRKMSLPPSVATQKMRNIPSLSRGAQIRNIPSLSRGGQGGDGLTRWNSHPPPNLPLEGGGDSRSGPLEGGGDSRSGPLEGGGDSRSGPLE